MLIATKHMGKVGIGATEPQFFRANDQNTYVVKLQNNRLGPKVLVNELVAAHLGKIMGLSFPTSDIIEINKQTLQENQYLLPPEITVGQHFASLHLKNAEYLGKYNLHKGINTAEMAGIILFDHMFHNVDRANNKKNLLIRQENTGYKLYAIDNSHLFRSGKWTAESLTRLPTRIKPYYRHSFALLLKDYLFPQDFLPYLEKARTICNQDIEKIIKEIPIEWLPDQLERQALSHHIRMGCDAAENIWHALCHCIPKIRGGNRWLYRRTIRPRHQRNIGNPLS